MADVLTTKTEVDATIEEIVSTEIQEVLTASMVMPGTITDLSAQVGPGMDKLKIPKFSNFTVNTKVAGTPVSAQANAFSTDDLDLDQHKVVQFLIEDIASLQAKVAVTQAYVAQAARDIAAQMDQKIIDDMEAGVSTAAPDHKRAYAGASLAKADVLLARQLLNTQNVALEGRSAVIAPDQEASLLAIAEFVRVDESGGSEALRNGRIGKLFGFDIFVSSQAESLKSLFYHRTAHAFARQLAPRVQQDMDLANLSQRWSLDHIYGSKHLDAGKRAVLMGTA